MQKKGHGIFHTLFKKEKLVIWGLFQNPVHPFQEVGHTYPADQHFVRTGGLKGEFQTAIEVFGNILNRLHITDTITRYTEKHAAIKLLLQLV